MRGLNIKRTLGCICSTIFCCLLLACGNSDTAGTYTVTVVTEYGKPMEDISVRIYSDSTKENYTAVGKTDENGSFSFESEDATGNVICLEDVPGGYLYEDTYIIDGFSVNITMNVQMLDEDALEGVIFKVGDVFADMSVVTSDGTATTISELLQTKKAVVLNFWYLNCGPCKTEFPYLQEAYAECMDDIEVIALNPVDGTDETVEAFKAEQHLTFMMGNCDEKWANALDITAYPMTVVIDRYGIIGYMHTGSITEKETFVKLFEFFTAEDYEQTVIKRLSELEGE